MKLMHLADLHIGKRVNEFSMIEDQKYILDQILGIHQDNNIDAVCIAGDIYDKSQPSVEAVELFDEFLTSMVNLNKPIYIISGNHDSPERLSFGKHLLKKNNLFICGVFNGGLEKLTIKDEYDKLNIFMLPFIKPVMVRNSAEEEIETYNDAVLSVLEKEKIDQKQRNILIAHQFVIGGTSEVERSDSENISVGGLDQVYSMNFSAFDYVALGHLHSPQKIGVEQVRYAGSPLKYSASEVKQKKAVTIVDIKEKGNVEIELIPLAPLHDMREIKGPLQELIVIGNNETEGRLDYIHAVLTDEEDLYDAVGQLKMIYENLMSISFKNSKTEALECGQELSSEDIENKSMTDLFIDFYKKQNNEELTIEQLKIVENIVEEIGGL